MIFNVKSFSVIKTSIIEMNIQKIAKVVQESLDIKEIMKLLNI